MNLYTKTSRWKILLILVGIVFMVMPLIYSNYLAKKLSNLELTKVQLFQKTLLEITKTTEADPNKDVTYELEMLTTTIQDLKVMAINKDQKIELYNFDEKIDTLELLEDFKSSGQAPLESELYTIYYQNPPILTLLTYFPLVQLFLLLLYAAIGYAVFNASRREEQNRIWVGMAKETAHQLGTPISGMIGWLENLRNADHSQEEQRKIIDEMEYDVMKLQQVADRFSKIGSQPELKEMDLVPELIQCKNYIAARASRNIQFEFSELKEHLYFAKININLFSWIIENVLRNALDAMGDTGKISFQISQDDAWVNIDIIDTGKGIPSSDWKKVFKPGFTTKSRGWGLGLSLGSRIIENYHQGKLFIKRSELGKGTTFTIQLPRIS
ncbi:MAG: HAMP domain-containing histidine kinase [Saprospiraceae bacterium]|nr:HAMP domain-containing histidine kinase [Saprospiraceae bacterium]MBK9727324.1 HAMP domain-containing histidine kinase [Saprospiraceae bacterium]